MGAAIAQVAVDVGLHAVVADARKEALHALVESVPEQCKRRLNITSDLAEVAACDVVVESIAEDPFAKTPLLAELQRSQSATAILSSNTSTLSIDRLAGELDDPSRFCGIHFFQPVATQPLIEVIEGSQTSAETMATAIGLARALRKMPLVVPDGPGFLVNRLIPLYIAEGLQLVGDGAPMEQVEEVAVDFGMGLGPLSLVDLVGVDVAISCAWSVAKAMEGRLAMSPLLVALRKAGRLGRKTGAGFFRYAEDGSRLVETTPDPELAKVAARWLPEQKPQDAETIIARLFLPIIVEATRMLTEGRADRPGCIDLATTHGFGFPADRGGLLFWADTLGAKKIVRTLQSLQESIGLRFQPTPILLEMADKDERFFGS